MKVIFSEDCLRQIKTIKTLANEDDNFGGLYTNISLCVKSLSEAKSIDYL